MACRSGEQGQSFLFPYMEYTMLYGHSQNMQAALPFIERTRPKYWHAIDPDADSTRRCIDLGVRLIVRHYRQDYDFNPDGVRSRIGWQTAQEAAFEFWADVQQQPWYSPPGDAQRPWAVTVPPAMLPGNPTDAEREWTVAFQAECVRLFGADGVECLVSNMPTGNDGFYVPGATYFCGQEYGWPLITTQQPWHALRFISWFGKVIHKNPGAKLFITECGVTQAVESRQDVGWQSDGGPSAADYWASLQEYDQLATAYQGYLGAFVYQVGGFPDWATFEVLGSEIEEWMAEALTTSESPPGQPEEGEGNMLPASGPEFETWWNAGGWRNFASWPGSPGFAQLSTEMRRTLVLDRIESATKETSEFLLSLNLA